MFCRSCGNQIEEGWKVCPKCGNEVVIEAEKKPDGGGKSETYNNTEQENDELKGQMKLMKSLIREHPIRSILCVPVVIEILFLVYTVITYNFYTVRVYGLMAVINDFLPIVANFVFCDIGLWLLYGPKNYKQVKEKVTGKIQKGNGVISHVVEFIVALVLIFMHQ